MTILLVLALSSTPTPTTLPSDVHQQAVSERGDHVMGFDHAKTTHHFRLTKTGGVIEAEAIDPEDTESRDQIQTHFPHIAKMFAEGNFEAPMLFTTEFLRACRK